MQTGKYILKERIMRIKERKDKRNGQNNIELRQKQTNE